jgi:hypothetical protein
MRYIRYIRYRLLFGGIASCGNVMLIINRSLLIIIVRYFRYSVILVRVLISDGRIIVRFFNIITQYLYIIGIIIVKPNSI